MLAGLLCPLFLIIIFSLLAARDVRNEGTQSNSVHSSSTHSSSVHSGNVRSGGVSSANWHNGGVSSANWHNGGVSNANWHNGGVHSGYWHNGGTHGGYWHNGSWYRWHGTYWIGGIPYYYYYNPYYSDEYCEVVPDGYIVVPAPVVSSDQQEAEPDASNPAQEPPQTQEKSPNKIIINIPNSHGGFTPVTLKKYKKGYIGPQGEFYDGKPTVKQLQVLYGD